MRDCKGRLVAEVEREVTAYDSASDLRPVQLVLAPELVLDQIRTAIALGRFAPGDHLPPERELAAMLQVSRATLRAALAVLASDGTIDIRRGRNGGIRVRELPPSDEWTRQGLRKQQKRLEKACEYRIIIETSCARLAAHRRTTKDLSRLRALVREMDALAHGPDRAEPRSGGRFHAIDHDFHLEIARASKNEWLVAAASGARIEMFRPGAIFKRIEPAANDLHAELVDAIEQRDADRAASLTERHISATLARVNAWIAASARSRANGGGRSRS